MEVKDVSVVIPICSPTKELVHLVYRLTRQTVKPKEIIIINSKEYFDSSKMIMELLEEKLKMHNDLELLKYYEISRSEFDHGATRNMGIELATSPYVLMMTQDAVPYNHKLVEKLLEAFDDDTVAIAYARQLPKKSCKDIEKFIRSFNYDDNDRVSTEADIVEKGIMAIFNSDVCSMYNVEKYDEVGGFPAKTIFNEDQIMAYKSLKAGYKVKYCSKAQVYHSHNYTLREEFRRNFDLGVSQVQFSHIYNDISSEDRGKKLVLDTVKHLVVSGKVYLIPKLVLSSASKYLGYLLGKRYKRLSQRTINAFTLNKNYWK